MKTSAKFVLSVMAASLLPLGVAAQTGSVSPNDSSQVLQNRNSVPAEVDKTGGDTKSSNATRDKKAQQGAGANAALASLNEADKKFVMEASISNATEIEASQLALAGTSNAKVKKFAEQMVKEHRQLGDELNATLQKQGIDVPRAEPKDETLSLLKSLRGDDLDRAYIEHVAVDEHRKAVELFSAESTNGGNAALKAAAKKALPKIKHHYEMGQQLAKSETSAEKAKATTK